jgi:lipopolysaccharide/colanic/teichoic acid biosynthesis glycosyltransferase
VIRNVPAGATTYGKPSLVGRTDDDLVPMDLYVETIDDSALPTVHDSATATVSELFRDESSSVAAPTEPSLDLDALGDQQSPNSGLQDAVLRGIDVAFAAALIAMLSPVFLAAAAAIAATSEGPVFFRQERMGRRGKRFMIYKFRTMFQGAEDRAHREYVAKLLKGAPSSAEGGAVFKIENDPRITPIGRLLRRLSIDELPQLLNVLQGDMSLVGPRPVIPWEAEMLDPRFARRFSVPAGMTGLWQVSGRSNVTVLEMLELDLAYVESRSVKQNLIIIAKTIPCVLSCRGAL